MKGYNFDWLDCLEEDESKAFGKVVSIFLRGIAEQVLADIDSDECIEDSA